MSNPIQPELTFAPTHRPSWSARPHAARRSPFTEIWGLGLTAAPAPLLRCPPTSGLPASPARSWPIPSSRPTPASSSPPLLPGLPASSFPTSPVAKADLPTTQTERQDQPRGLLVASRIQSQFSWPRMFHSSSSQTGLPAGITLGALNN